MATVLSTTEDELIGFQSQLCRVSRQSAPVLLLQPFSTLSAAGLFLSSGRAARERRRRRRVRSITRSNSIRMSSETSLASRAPVMERSPREFGVRRRDGFEGVGEWAARGLLRDHRLGQMER